MTALEQPERASNLFENASLAARGSLTPGVQLGPYEVLGPIGKAKTLRERLARLMPIDVAIEFARHQQIVRGSSE